MHPPRPALPGVQIAIRFHVLAGALAAALLAGCAATGTGTNDAPAVVDSRAATPRPQARAADDAAETERPSGEVDWVAVFESPRDAKYSDQRVIYVDRNSVEPHQLDKLTYYLARTREVTRSGAKPKVQEIAVLCEGSPIAPATSLRAEGTEERNGGYSLKHSPTPLTSVNQFSTQRVRADATNPNPFIVRAICLLGTGG
jgi:hypothetical protein